MPTPKQTTTAPKKTTAAAEKEKKAVVVEPSSPVGCCLQKPHKERAAARAAADAAAAAATAAAATAAAEGGEGGGADADADADADAARRARRAARKAAEKKAAEKKAAKKKKAAKESESEEEESEEEEEAPRRASDDDTTATKEVKVFNVKGFVEVLRALLRYAPAATLETIVGRVVERGAMYEPELSTMAAWTTEFVRVLYKERLAARDKEPVAINKKKRPADDEEADEEEAAAGAASSKMMKRAKKSSDPLAPPRPSSLPEPAEPRAPFVPALLSAEARAAEGADKRGDAGLKMSLSELLALGDQQPSATLTADEFKEHHVASPSEFAAWAVQTYADVGALLNPAKRGGETSRLWQLMRIEKLQWCIARGRILDFKTFAKQNLKSTLVPKFGTLGGAWAAYTDSWDSVIGLQSSPRRRIRSPSSSPAPPKAAAAAADSSDAAEAAEAAEDEGGAEEEEGLDDMPADA